ncbi:MAG TPA: YidC/Oxa1 family membrane protein insertase [Patescibacteria group bacterium]|jgi:YidC/Oxa1 family membrane protein insertase|nr:YidC/Oxa1 family membrane protein insertase [Patescibacteria group bacterium]
MLHFIGHIYTLGIYQPILNLLVGLYNIIPGHDIGVVIILITLVIRFILAPFMHKSLKGQKQMSSIQPKIAALREKHKGDQAEQTKAITELYKEHGINPFSSCLPLVVQLPILIALYQVFRQALRGNLSGLYHFVHNPGMLNSKLFGIVDLASPNIAFAIIAGMAQFWQSWLMMKSQNQDNMDATAKAMTIPTLYVLPLVSVYIAWKLPAGLPLYWIITTLFAVGQQYYFNRTHVPDEIVVKANEI